VLDGGVPLVLFYTAAIGAAFFVAGRIALGGAGGALGLMGAMVFAYDVGALASEVEKAAALLADAPAHRAMMALARASIAALRRDDEKARQAFDEALTAARTGGQKEWIWRILESRARLMSESGQSLLARRDIEEALAVLEEIAVRLPRDLREVYWDDARRRRLRDFASSRTSATSAPAPATRAGGSTGQAPPQDDRLGRILEINRELAAEHDLPRLLERVTDHAISLLRAERGFVILAGAKGDLSVHASRDRAGDDPHARFSRSIAEKVISTREPVVSQSARDDDRMAGYLSVHQLMLQSVACVPISAPGGRAIGALYVETRLRPGTQFNEELPTLAAFADQVAIAIEHARLVTESAERAAELKAANGELERARARLEELLGHRTAQLDEARRDLRTTRAVLRSHFGYQGLVGTSSAMRKVYALIDRIKDTDVPVLITGESGTGKEIVAHAIHNAGRRSKGAFTGINCGAIPEHLLESELFGHVRGAFTGAERDHKGLFREADGGTLLLDEIGEMPKKMQAGLLRVLQEKVVRPVGGDKEQSVDVRLIAATNRDLAAMVEASAFREDLYYRLHVVEVRLPPLRERLEDLPPLIDHFFKIFAARLKRDKKTVSREALRKLSGHNWPGNVRQLENALLNAFVMSDRPELLPDDFDLPVSGGRRSAADAPPPSTRSRSLPPSSRPASSKRSGPASKRRIEDPSKRRDGEKERILSALKTCNWNRVKAAHMLGLPRRTFYRRLKEHGIQ
jgi:transcriptional regulator with GAF, ATPase, and Fis domain